MMAQEITDGDGVSVYISNAQLLESKEKLVSAVGNLRELLQGEDETPTFRLFAFQQLMVNIVLKHIINNNETDFVTALRDAATEEYKIFADIADEIRTSISDLIADIPFVCTRIDLFDGDDLVKLYIRFIENGI